MAVDGALVTVGTTATSLLTGVSDSSRAPKGTPVARSILLTNRGASSVYLGGPAVTTSAYGYVLAAGGELALDLGDADIPYGIVTSGTVVVAVLHLGIN